MLKKEEYIEQEFFFRTFRERLDQGYTCQEILLGMKNELLDVSSLPIATEIILTEVKHSGKMSFAMQRLLHYFTPFQVFVVKEAEKEEGKFDFRIALQVLEREAKFRSNSPSPQGAFFYQFETLSRNRLGFDYGLEAIANDPIFDENWRFWINVILRRQVGFIDIAKLVYVRSKFYKFKDNRLLLPKLFNEQEGRIAYASIGHDPLFLFSALSRHLGYPSVPRLKLLNENITFAFAEIQKKIELLENKVTLIQEELKGGINLERFYVKSS